MKTYLEKLRKLIQTPMDTSKLKPFDLQKALAGDPVVTREGDAVLTIAHFPNAHYGHVIAHVTGSISPYMYYPNGDHSSNGLEHDYDLFMAPKTREVWINLYPPLEGKVWGRWTEHGSEDAADAYDRTDSFERFGNCAHKIVITE